MHSDGASRVDYGMMHMDCTVHYDNEQNGSLLMPNVECTGPARLGGVGTRSLQIDLGIVAESGVCNKSNITERPHAPPSKTLRC